MATQDQRVHMLAVAKYLIHQEPKIFWAEHRPMKNIGWFEQDLENYLKGHGNITMDCSESVTLICKLGGLKDPNGSNYNGYGFTGTLLSHLPHYANPTDADIGALCVFGPGSGEHVTMVLSPGPDPLMFSHGQNAGPVAIRLSEERKFHKPGVTFLSIAKL